MQHLKIPYEFLARWNHVTGELQGAHVKIFEVVKGDAGEVIMSKEGDAQPVAVGQETGFPLESVLTALESGAIMAMDNAMTDKCSAVAERDTAVAALAAERSAHEATKAELASLRAAADQSVGV